MSADTNLESVLKKELIFSVESDEYVFRIPSVMDRISILGKAVALRKEANPDSGIAAGYDPNLVMSTETLATFIVLLKSTSAKWVYTPGPDGKPVMDLTKWPDNVPVTEVVNQFNEELDKFRAGGN